MLVVPPSEVLVAVVAVSTLGDTSAPPLVEVDHLTLYEVTEPLGAVQLIICRAVADSEYEYVLMRELLPKVTLVTAFASVQLAVPLCVVLCAPLPLALVA